MYGIRNAVLLLTFYGALGVSYQTGQQQNRRYN
jgi:hypothetical protein